MPQGKGRAARSFSRQSLETQAFMENAPVAFAILPPASITKQKRGSCLPLHSVHRDEFDPTHFGVFEFAFNGCRVFQMWLNCDRLALLAVLVPVL